MKGDRISPVSFFIRYSLIYCVGGKVVYFFSIIYGIRERKMHV